MKHLKQYESDNSVISEGLNYHLERGIPLSESIFRIESEAWIDLINEARKLWETGVIDLSDDDLFLISNDIGERAIYEDTAVLLDIPFENEEMDEAEYRGKKVNLNKPFRTPGGPRKFSVYTKNESGNIVKVSFGQPGMRVNNDNPEKARSFRKRMQCDNPGPKWKPRYWACNVGRYSKLLGLKSGRPW